MNVKEINDKLIACKNYYNAAQYKNLNVSLDYEINKIIPIKRFNAIRECYQFYLTVPARNHKRTLPQLLRIELLWTDKFFVRDVYIPEQTIKIDDWAIKNFPDLYQFQNTVVDDNFDVTYFLDVLESIYSEFESREILYLKNNLLIQSYKAFRNLSCTELNRSLRFCIENYRLCLNGLISEKDIPSNDSLLSKIHDLNCTEDMEQISIKIKSNDYSKSNKIITARYSDYFSSMLEEKIKWMKEDFYRTPHTPACGEAEIIIEYLNLFTEQKKYKHIYFKY